MDSYETILLIVAALVALGLAWFFIRAEKKRREEIRQLAQKLGLQFSEKGDTDFLSILGKFPLFTQGHTNTLLNQMRGKFNNHELAFFDYSYVTGGEENHTHYAQSIICLPLDGPELPRFSLRPRNVLHKVGRLLGYQDYDFGSHPDFSQKYLLRGEEEAAVRKLFTAAKLAFYEQNPGLSTEGSGHTLLYYQPHVIVAPQAIPAFLEDALKVLTLYQSDAEQAGYAPR